MKLSLSERDRICFLGDSITAGGLWIAEVFEYFVETYPEKKIELYNCGISGSKGYEADIHNRLFCDFFNYFPKYGVIMFGMNDINRILYSDNCKEKNKEKLKNDEINRYSNAIENVVFQCTKRGITPILCSPTPYDQYNDFDTENLNADTALTYLHNVVEKIANDNNLIFVDMRNPLIENIENKPIKEDRVHPNEYGQHLMAQEFINSIEDLEYTPENKKFIFSAQNKKRFDIEQIIRLILFVERDYLGWQYLDKFPTVEERKLKVKELMFNETSWLKDVYEQYLKYVDYIEEFKGQLIKETSNMYK